MAKAKAAMTGGALAAGGAVVDASLATAGAGVAAVEGAAIVAAVPAILTGAAIVGGVVLLCKAEGANWDIPEDRKEPKYKLVRQPDGKMRRVPK